MELESGFYITAEIWERLVLRGGNSPGGTGGGKNGERQSRGAFRRFYSVLLEESDLTSKGEKMNQVF